MAWKTHEINIPEIPLQPCPLCGGKAEYYQKSTMNYYVFVGEIRCTECGVTTKEMPDAFEKTKDKIVFEDWRERAAYFWNQRKEDVIK